MNGAMTLNFGSFFVNRLVREEEEEGGGGGGAYSPDFRYFFYVSLDPFCSEKSDVGAAILEEFRALDLATQTEIRIKHPYAGKERQFRADIEEVLGSAILRGDDEALVTCVITKEPIDS